MKAVVWLRRGDGSGISAKTVSEAIVIRIVGRRGLQDMKRKWISYLATMEMACFK